MSNFKNQMTKEAQNTKNEKVYDLEERTGLFGEDVIVFIKMLPHDRINNELAKQFVRSGTSIGANYMEADGAESIKDFRQKSLYAKRKQKNLSTG